MNDGIVAAILNAGGHIPLAELAHNGEGDAKEYASSALASVGAWQTRLPP